MKFNINGELVNLDNVILNARLEACKLINNEYKLFVVCAKGQLNEDDVPVLYRRKKLKKIRYWQKPDGYPYFEPSDNKPNNKKGWFRPRIENTPYRYLEFHLEKATQFCTDTEDYWEIVPNDFNDICDLCETVQSDTFINFAGHKILLNRTLLAFEITRNGQKILNQLRFKVNCWENADNNDVFKQTFGIRVL